jgi:hypothetical protein
MPNIINKKPMTPARFIVAVVVILIAGYFGIDLTQGDLAPARSTIETNTTASHSGSAPTIGVAASQRTLVDLASQGRSGEMVEFQARIVRILPDDNDGSRHQRFLLAIDYTPSNTDSVLIAHNIDLAPRVPVEEGDLVRVYGQYEFNDKGGVVHWTHHDPKNWREGGWIEHHGIRYE